MFVAVAVMSVVLADAGADLNAKGEALLRSGHAAEALQLFRGATEASPRFAAAFYNMALALADLRHTPNVRVRPSKKDVLDAVEVAAQLDPKLRQRAQELPAVRTTFRGQRLLGRTIEHDTSAILQGITWRSRSDERLDFLSDGTVRYWNHPELTDRVPRPSGRWAVVGGHVSVAFGSKSFDGEIGSDGVLSLAGWGRFFDW